MKKINKKRRAAGSARAKLLIGLIVLVVLVIVSALAYFLSRPRPIEHVTIQLNWVHNAQFAGLYVAKDKGFYQDAGLDVTIKPFTDGLDEGKDLAAGKATYSIYTPIELLADIAKGRQFRAIAAIYQTSPFAFVSLKSTGIQSPQDFIGKVLGAKGGNLDARLTYPALARSYGILPNSYQIKDLDFSVDEGQDITMHRADMVDLYRTDQLFFLNKRHINYNLLLPEEFGFKSYGDTIVTTQKQIDMNPDQVRRFVAATQAGWTYALAHQAEALQIVEKYEDPLYKDVAHEAYILAHSTPLIQPTGGKPIGSMDVIAWNNVVNTMHAAGTLKASITANDVYTTQFLQD